MKEQLDKQFKLLIGKCIYCTCISNMLRKYKSIPSSIQNILTVYFNDIKFT